MFCHSLWNATNRLCSNFSTDFFVPTNTHPPLLQIWHPYWLTWILCHFFICNLSVFLPGKILFESWWRECSPEVSVLLIQLWTLLKVDARNSDVDLIKHKNKNTEHVQTAGMRRRKELGILGMVWAASPVNYAFYCMKNPPECVSIKNTSFVFCVLMVPWTVECSGVRW